MDYYLLPIEKDEAILIEETLRKVNYDVDDRALVWNSNEINNIANSLTKENALEAIIEFLPEPIGDKFVKLFNLKIG